MAAFQVFDNCPDGAQMGDSTLSKWAFAGLTPTVPRDSSAAATAVGAIALTSSDTTCWGFDSSAHATTALTQINALATGYNAIRSALVEKGIML